MAYKIFVIIAVLLAVVIGVSVYHRNSDSYLSRQSHSTQASTNNLSFDDAAINADLLPKSVDAVEVAPSPLPESLLKYSNTSENTEFSAADLIRDYMTAWSGNNTQAMGQLWLVISQCEECLLMIRDLMTNQSIPKGMLLELSYRIIQLDDPHMLPVFDNLVNPSVDNNVRTIVVQQLVREGSQQYVRKLLQLLESLDNNGYSQISNRLLWALAKLKNSAGVSPILDVITGSDYTNSAYVSHVNTVFKSLVSGMGSNQPMTAAIVDYYFNAEESAQKMLDDIVFSNSTLLSLLAANAYEQGFNEDFHRFTEGILRVNNVAAVDSIMSLQKRVGNEQEYIIDVVQRLLKARVTSENLQRLEDYLRNPESNLRTKIVAAEGLLVVQHIDQAKYILEKLVNSSSYADAEIVTYVHSRLR